MASTRDGRGTPYGSAEAREGFEQDVLDGVFHANAASSLTPIGVV